MQGLSLPLSRRSSGTAEEGSSSSTQQHEHAGDGTPAVPPKMSRAAGSWWVAVSAIFLQLAAASLLVLFVASSLTVSSTSSWILGRDVSLGDYISSARIERARLNTSIAGGSVKAGRIARDQVFDAERALDDLEEITRTPHSLNDPRSIQVRDYLRKTIQGIIEGSAAEFHDPTVNGTTAEFRDEGSLVYWEDSSLIVRVPGTSNQTESFLVQAHYDAVPISYGAYDDGVGVVVCLELLRNLVRYPVRNPVVINIDWGEEIGLFGAVLFARFHPWAEDIRGYLNLEAGGVGGRAMLFRASHPELLSAYKRAVQKPYASLIGNDAMRLGIVHSDTDFSIYTTRYGVPGLDLAFADHRNFYHTSRDNARHATVESVLSMGAAALSVTREIADSATILSSIPRSSRLPERPTAKPPTSGNATASSQHHPGVLTAADESFGALRDAISIQNLQHVIVAKGSVENNAIGNAVFYDILSRFMVVRSYTCELGLNIATGILGIALIVALQFPFTRPLPARASPGSLPDNLAALKPVERLVLQLGRGGFFSGLFEGLGVLLACYISALFGSLVFTGVMVNLVAPRLAYTHLYLQLLLQFSAAALSATCVLTAWVRRSRLPDIESMVWYSSGLLRCLVLLFVVAPLNAKTIGLLYREQLYAWASLSAVVFTALMDQSTGVGKAWQAWLARIAPGRSGRRVADAPSDGDEERLLSRASASSRQENDDVSTSDNADASHDSVFVTGTLYAFSILRLLLGVFVPLVIGADTMLRQLVVFKDHLADGSPTAACLGIAALDITTFVVFLAPYALSIMIDVDRYWLIHYIGDLTTPYIQAALQKSSQIRPGGLFPSARSQISLRTNHAESRRSIDTESQHSYTEQAPDASAENNEAEESIIVLGSGARANNASEVNSVHSGGAQSSVGSNDDELGSRPLSTLYRKRESPETIGVRMIYVWTLTWLLLWVVTQLSTLAGESYDQKVNPLKVYTYQSSRVSTQCLTKSDAKDECVSSTLNLASPDSHGLAGLLQKAAPRGSKPFCFTRNTADFYHCKIPWDIASSGADDGWSPAAAINVTSVSHTAASVDHGTLFTVAINFTAPETRTCFIDFGSHRGFSPQSYPNPRPALPPLEPTTNSTDDAPVIDRVTLPVIERARFVHGVSGASAPIVEPVYDRDAIFSGRIFAHKRDFDADGRFAAIVQYSVPQVNATRPGNLKVEVSCYFDLVDKHTPLLASVAGASPAWVTFTPNGNTLSQVTLVDVEI